MADLDKFDNDEHVLHFIEDKGVCGIIEENKKCFTTMKYPYLYVRDGEVKADNNGNGIYFKHDTENNGGAYLVASSKYNVNGIFIEMNKYEARLRLKISSFFLKTSEQRYQVLEVF